MKKLHFQRRGELWCKTVVVTRLSLHHFHFSTSIFDWSLEIFQLQYKSVIALSDVARNRLKGEFFDGPNFPTVKLIGYNA